MASFSPKIQTIYFNTRTYFYNCSYKKITKLLAKRSLSFKDLKDNTKLYEYIAFQYFKDSSISNVDFFRFEKGKKKECKKHDFTIFRLNLSDDVIKRWFSAENVLKNILPLYKKLLLYLCIYRQPFIKISDTNDKKKKFNFNKTILLNEAKNNTIDDINKLFKAFSEIKGRFKIIKYKLNHYQKDRFKQFKTNFINKDYLDKLIDDLFPKNDQEEILGELKEKIQLTGDDKYTIGEKGFNIEYIFLNLINHQFNKIDDYFDAFNIYNENNLELLAFVSSSGIINFSFIKEDFANGNKGNIIEFEPTTDIKNGIDPEILKNALKVSKEINSKIDKLAKLHMVINLNDLGNNKKQKNYFGFYSEKDSRLHIKRDIYQSSNAYKATYLKFYFDYNNPDNCQEEKRFYFNLVSTMVGYSHEFDEYSIYLMNIGEDGYRHYYKQHIVNDLLNEETSHLYYCDGGFTYSILDPIPNAKELSLASGNEFLLSSVPMHQFTIYSKQDFSKLVSALTFGSASNRMYDFFLKYAVYELRHQSKFVLLYKQHSITSIYSDINLRFNYLQFAGKGKNIGLLNHVFNSINSNDYEESVDNALNVTWRHSNLVTNKFYSRLGIYMSIASLFITLVSFGWIGFIVPTLESQPDNIPGLLAKFWTIPKFYSVVIIALIPIIIWMAISSITLYRTWKKKRNLIRTFFKKIFKGNRYRRNEKKVKTEKKKK